LSKKGAVGGSKIAGGVCLNLRDGMKNWYLSCLWNISLTKWYKRWFYIREEPGSATFYDVGYVPEKRTSWTDRPKFSGQVTELMGLIDWSRLEELGVVRNFLAGELCSVREGCMPCMSTRVGKIRPDYA